jgi:hypothetical protein
LNVPNQQLAWTINRRLFLQHAGFGLGAAAFHTLASHDTLAIESSKRTLPHHAPKAKRVIYLCQSGAPSQLDLFDYKPELTKQQGQQLPESIRKGQRLTSMTSEQSKWLLTPSKFAFKQHGESRQWFSELVPHMSSVADELCMIHSMHTEAINHDPAITYIQTGHQQSGRPCIGSWAAYGLGSENQNLPAFVVLLSRGRSLGNQQPLYDRLWGSGFLSSINQGVKLRGGADPVLYLKDPPGVSKAARQRMLSGVKQLNSIRSQQNGDPEIEARSAQYEMAGRMQMSVPELTDLSNEPESVFQLYGEDARRPGSYAHNCLMARRLAERDVRFIQLYHRGWDQHTNLPRDLQFQCRDTDQASAALVKDLKQRGLLEDTLVVWGGEFGRTSYCQGELTADNYGRDHHPRCYSIWMAGAGVKRGYRYGETDDLGYNVVQDGVHVHDLNATIMHLLGIDHKRLTYRHQGRDFRLTDIHGDVVKSILS